MPAPSVLPTGTVTFLLTDIEGSTRLWESVPESMEIALERHNRLLTDAIEMHGGVVVVSRGEGDSFFAAFPSAVDAVEAAGDCQRRLNSEPWPEGASLRVRMGLHTGEARVLAGDYVDHIPINRCARVKAAAHGGQVLVTKATSDLVQGRLSGGFALIKLGAFRLRDLVEPELILQLTHADLARDFPPIRTASERASNLPLQVSSFVGRRDELGRIEAALDGSRVVTLTGPGGVGKTRLALQVAEESAPHFEDGVWLCELASVQDSSLVDDAVAAVFSVRAPGGQSARQAVADYLRSRHVLVVLDNCEHVLAEAASLAHELARACEHLVILATSREGLGIEGERLLPVAPLSVPGEQEDVTAITNADAVRLFADRAAYVKPGFAVTKENAESVAEVVRRLDGVALAIELAAARAQAMTPAELARRLERSFAVLGGGRRSAVDRHQTLRATIDWSFELLSEPEQHLLCRLSVFTGDASLAAVEAVCGGSGIDPDEVLDLLARLVSRSLVVPVEHGPTTRYGLLETIRQYGEQRLREAGEEQRWRARHADYYAEYLHRVRDPDPDDDRFWGARITIEQDNLLQAWSWAARAGNIDIAFKILVGFAPCEVWSTYPLVLPGDAVLDLPGAADHPLFPLAAAVSAGFATNRADVGRAEELCRRALDANAGQDRPAWRVEEVVTATRANLATLRGAFAEAAGLSERAARIAQAGGDLADTSVLLTVAVACYVLADEAASAVPLSREALTFARLVGAPALTATALLEVGAAVVETDPDQARQSMREGLELSESLGYGRARDLVCATGIASRLDDRPATLDLAIRALRSLQRSGDRLLMGITLQKIAGALAASKPDAAAIVLGAAEAYVIESSKVVLRVRAAVETALTEEDYAALHARGARMEWDAAVDFALAQATQALVELEAH
jgi:predicted ATPase/class 3 adenylate cyclase